MKGSILEFIHHNFKEEKKKEEEEGYTPPINKWPILQNHPPNGIN